MKTRPRLKRLAALTTFAVALTAVSAMAEQTVLAPPVASRVAIASLADLEDAFWVCDYTAATRGPEGSDVTVCTAVYEAIKERKFGGDFGGLLDWWRQNKVARHDALAAVEAMQARR